jgi:hypothetical protein
MSIRTALPFAFSRHRHHRRKTSGTESPRPFILGHMFGFAVLPKSAAAGSLAAALKLAGDARS